MHIHTRLPTLTPSCSNTSSVAPCSVAIAVCYNDMILVPEPDTLSDVGGALSEMRASCVLCTKCVPPHVSGMPCFSKQSLPQSSGFKQCKIYVWKTVCSWLIYIYIYIYIYVYIYND